MEIVRLFFKIAFAAAILLLIVWFIDQKTGSVDNFLSKNKSDKNISVLFTENTKFPSVTGIDSIKIYQTYLNQYMIRPDNRFIDAFKALIILNGRRNDNLDSVNPYSIGKIRFTKSQVFIPLLKDTKPVETLTIALPISFSEQMKSMQRMLEIMGVSKNINPAHPQDPIWLGELSAAISEFNRIDSRSIINGMLILEKLRKTAGDDPRLILAAAKGYAMMLLGLEPDHMEYKSRFASLALAFLAFAKQIGPEVKTERVEAILAMNMGYTAYATELLNRFSDSVNVIDRILEAYMKKDVKTLENIKGGGPSVLGYYLLARLYRQMGLEKLSQKEAEKLLQRFPNNYPAIVESIYTVDLNIAKQLTLFYPIDIYVRTTKKITLESMTDKDAWYNRIKIFIKSKIPKVVSFTQFNTILSEWSPLTDSSTPGFFIGDDEIKQIYRALYSGAIFLRFNLLLNRWSVVEKADNFVDTFRKDDPNHPLVMEMMAELLDEKGLKKEAENLFVSVINHPECSSELALRAHAFFHDYSLAENRTSPMVASCQDGRPAGLAGMGELFYRNLHYDFAEKFYTMSLENDPYAFNNYYYLAKITGDDTPVKLALEKYPSNLKMLKSAGDYYLTKNDMESQESAYQCFKRAVELVPSNSSHTNRLSKVLVKMNRHDEAISVLENWINKFGSTDLATTIKWGSIGDIYLKLDQVFSAAEILIDNSDTYLLTRFYLENKKRFKASDTIAKKIEMYETAYQHLNTGQVSKASEVLTAHQYDDICDLIMNSITAKTSDRKNRPYIKNENTLDKILLSLKNKNYKAVRTALEKLVKINHLSDNNLDALIISCIDSGEIVFAIQILEGVIKRYQQIPGMLENRKNKNALGLISKNLDDYQGGIIVHTARVYEELNQLALAERILNKGLKRHFTSGHMFSSAAAFLWRNGRFDEAAELIVNGNKNKDKFSRWFFNDFIETFINQPDNRIIDATESLIHRGIDQWHITNMGYLFLRKSRAETAHKLISKIPASGRMQDLLKIANLYIILKAWKGEKEANEYILKTVQGNTRSLFALVLFEQGLYEVALKLVKNPNSFSNHQEFVWLQKLMASLAMEQIPEEIKDEFDSHYSNQSPDVYHAIGRFLLDKISRQDLLKLIKTNKQRCEFSYYIGFAERMKGNFPEAANWYQICKETLLENNGEFHWASTEMFWWAHMGTKMRHLLLSDDMKEYYARRNEVYLK